MVRVDPVLASHIKWNVEQLGRPFEPRPMPWQRHETEAPIRLPVPSQALENIQSSYHCFAGDVKSGLFPFSYAAAEPYVLWPL